MKQYLVNLIIFLFFFSINATSFAQQKVKQKEDKAKVKMEEGKMKMNEMKMQNFSPLDTLVIEKITGIKGKASNGEYKVTIPQNDLSIEVDGFKIIPAMGLGTWIDFAPSSDGAMIMGDLVLTENDIKPVQQEIIRQGLTITAIHNHFVRNHPNVMYMHVGGSGNLEQVAQKAKAVLDKIKEVRGGDPSKGTASNGTVDNSLDTKKLDDILGNKAEMNKGVCKYTIGRPDVNLREHGVKVTTFMGFNTWAAFQGTPEHAAVAGDFTMLENEVAPVIKALIENGIEVVAVHNHMVHEQPKIFFLHYWGVGNAEQLAKGLKAALDQTKKGNAMGMLNH
jgi:anti-sigma28 factor (negative regulator of flagellin synthesis)